MPRSTTPLLLLLALAACIPGQSHRPAPAPPRKPPRHAPPPAARPRPVPPQPAPPSPRLGYERVEIPGGSPPPPFETNRVAAAAEESQGGVYIVKPGDSLRRISERTNAGSEAIARENGLKPPFTIRVGQKLRIPAGRWHKVRTGETGIAIARAYGVEWSRIAALNELTEPYILRAGQRLLLPSTQEVAGMTLEQRAHAFQLDIGDIITGGEPAIARNAEPEKPRTTGPRHTPLSPDIAVAAPTPFDGRFLWPADGKVVRGYGVFGPGRRNDGIDIGTTIGAPITAAADGVVVYAGTGIAAYGGLILIRHSDTWTTAYGHAGELLVTRGQAVKRGQVIARAGQSGLADRPELHFEIRQGAKPVDPAAYLPRRG